MGLIVLHIGLPKTGTTFIQNAVFSKLPVTTLRGWHKHRDIMNCDFGKPIIISDQTLSANPFGKDYFNKFKENMMNIKILYGNPYIIFGVRKHEDFLYSLYIQYLYQGGTELINYLYNEKNTGIIKHEDLFFEDRINLLKTIFTNVFVYSQESLGDNFTKALKSFLGVNSNAKINYAKRFNQKIDRIFQIKLIKKLNRIKGFYSKPLRKLKITPRYISQYFKFGKRYELDSSLKNYISVFYKKDWNKTKKLISYGIA